MAAKINMLGRIFGKLTIIKEAGVDNWEKIKYLCQCSCGNETIVLGTCLRSGRTQSCGCFKTEMTIKAHSGSSRSIETRIKMSEKNSGENNPNWQGGKSFEQYCGIWSDKEFKEYILKRDNYRCQNPDCWGNSNGLNRHHINYDKKDCAPNNITTLCISCNARANKDRVWHELWYRTIMEKKNQKGICL